MGYFDSQYRVRVYFYRKRFFLPVLVLLLVPIFMVYFPMIRRFHDLNQSGWFVLLMAIPVVGFFVPYVIGFIKGDTGSNNYGPDPFAPGVIKATLEGRPIAWTKPQPNYTQAQCYAPQYQGYAPQPGYTQQPVYAQQPQGYAPPARLCPATAGLCPTTSCSSLSPALRHRLKALSPKLKVLRLSQAHSRRTMFRHSSLMLQLKLRPQNPMPPTAQSRSR